MFRFDNVDIDAGVIFTSRDKKEQHFIVESILNRRLKDVNLIDTVFHILNEFIKYKGSEFHDEIDRRLMESKDIIMKQALQNNLDPIPYKIVHNVLDLFDYEEVVKWIKESGVITVPSKFPDVYDDIIELDEKGSREQTYLKDDYIDLIALITILKSVSCLIGDFASVKTSQLNSNSYKEYILFNFLRTHPIYSTRGFVKLQASIDKLVDRLFSDGENAAVRIIEKVVSKESLPIVITAQVTLQVLMFSNELTGNDTRNIVTKIYSFTSNKLKLKDASSNINIKYFSNNDTNLESESILESYRVPSTLALGFVEEFKMVFSDINKLREQMGLKDIVNDDEFFDVYNSFRSMANHNIVEEVFFITSWLFKGIIDPRAFDYLEMEHLINALTVGFLKLWYMGHKDLAMIMGSYSSSTEVFRVNFSLRNKISNNIREELNAIYPFMKTTIVAGEVNHVSYIEETISSLAKNLMTYNLINILPDKYVLDYQGTLDRSIRVNEDIKNKLALMVIDISKYI